MQNYTKNFLSQRILIRVTSTLQMSYLCPHFKCLSCVQMTKQHIIVQLQLKLLTLDFRIFTAEISTSNSRLYSSKRFSSWKIEQFSERQKRAQLWTISYTDAFWQFKIKLWSQRKIYAIFTKLSSTERLTSPLLFPYAAATVLLVVPTFTDSK